MNVRPQYLQHNIQNLSCVNTLYCVNVALIDDTCDDIDIVDAGNLSRIELPCLQQKEFVHDIGIDNDLSDKEKSYKTNCV